MIYRKGAFDHYDTIFCAGLHHKKEIRAMEAQYGLPQKHLVEHGYARLDAIVDEAKKRQEKPDENRPQHILIAPSWGADCTIESGIAQSLIEKLLKAGFFVTLRPHPQTLKFGKDKIDKILQLYGNNELFAFEANVAGQESLHQSDMMVCDWSGAALDYAFGLKKPVLFIDVPRKINNPDYQDIGIEPFEVTIRNKIGTIVQPEDDIVECINKLQEASIDDDYYYQNANARGTKALLKLLETH
jgi:CDP-glycerol glycerophosphotransferase (TagB/SpsB family)